MEATAIADHVYLISGGRVVEGGTPAQINQSDSPWVRQFMSGEADGPVPFHYPAGDYVQHLLGEEGS